MIFEILRYTVFGVFVLASAAAIGSWAVRTRRISPFTKSAQLIRRSTDPVLKPIESWLHRRGGNPQNAEWWLVGGALGGGIVLISVAGWLASQAARLGAIGARPFGIVRLGIYYAGNLVVIALVVRVIGSWIGWDRYSRFMKPVYILTDWIVTPLRRVIPPIGMIDITPLVAFFLVQILVGLLTGL